MLNNAQREISIEIPLHSISSPLLFSCIFFSHIYKTTVINLFTLIYGLADHEWDGDKTCNKWCSLLMDSRIVLMLCWLPFRWSHPSRKDCSILSIGFNCIILWSPWIQTEKGKAKQFFSPLSFKLLLNPFHREKDEAKQFFFNSLLLVVFSFLDPIHAEILQIIFSSFFHFLLFPFKCPSHDSWREDTVRHNLYRMFIHRPWRENAAYKVFFIAFLKCFL